MTGREIANIIAEGLGINPAAAAKGLGIRGGGGSNRGQGRGGRPRQVPDAQRPANAQQTQGRQPAR
jgi:hypothetical protein